MRIVPREKSLVSIGDRFGMLTVAGESFVSKPGTRASKWAVCKCDCGQYSAVSVSDMRTGNTKSCGCARAAVSLPAAWNSSRQHGGSSTRLYRIWNGMLNRCHNKKAKCYPRYGGRGIAVCDEWRNSFPTFRDWADTHGYSDELQIDRVNNEAGYSPENCRFATRTENARNKRNNAILTAFGESKPMSAWVSDDRCKVGYKTLHTRISCGWGHAEAIGTHSRSSTVNVST